MGELDFSVLIPAYQAAGTVARAIDSALAQDVEDVEVVVCNDGSTDATVDVLASYGERIVVVDQPNRGLAAARNAAFRASRGSVCVLLDSDDEWEPARLRRMSEMLTTDAGASIVTTDAWVVAPGVPAERWYGRHATFVPPDQQAVEILRENFVFGGAAIRRDALERIGGFDESLPHGSEYEAWVRILLGGGRAVLVDEPLATYHRSDSTLSTADRRDTYAMVLAVLDRTEAEFDLSAAQLEALDEQRRRKQRWLDVLDALTGLAEAAPDTAARCRRASRNRDLELVKRAVFAAAAGMPRLASRAYRRLPASLLPDAYPSPRPGGGS